HQQRVAVARPEDLLQGGELGDALLDQALQALLQRVLVEAAELLRYPAGVVIRKPDRLPGRNPEAGDRVPPAHGRAVGSSPLASRCPQWRKRERASQRASG